ncbi:serine/threonine/tyrosine-protein kinase HT1-like isoform X2 [Wolffia australiana]
MPCSFLWSFPLGRKKKKKSLPHPLSPSTFAPSSYSSPSSSVGYEPDSPQSVVDATESWSTLLEPGSFESADSAELWKADLSQLLIGHMFAAGSRSRIYRGIYKNRAVAVKMVKPLEHEDEEIRALLEKQFTCEVAMLSGLSHPNIVQFIAACRKPPVYCIITEYMSQGTLRTFLHKQEPFSLSLPRILAMALDISRGMKYIHSQGVIHRDLKSDNLLLNGNLRVKVADLGTSCFDKRRRVASKEGNPGTYRWMAPEMIKNKSCTRKVDVYSFGMVLWELTTALVPFQELTPVQAAYAAYDSILLRWHLEQSLSMVHQSDFS